MEKEKRGKYKANELTTQSTGASIYTMAYDTGYVDPRDFYRPVGMSFKDWDKIKSDPAEFNKAVATLVGKDEAPKHLAELRASRAYPIRIPEAPAPYYEPIIVPGWKIILTVVILGLMALLIAGIL